jgi:hypothetical protein
VATGKRARGATSEISNMLRGSSPGKWAGRRIYEQVKLRERAPQAPEDIDVSDERKHKRTTVEMRDKMMLAAADVFFCGSKYTTQTDVLVSRGYTLSMLRKMRRLG